MGTMKTRKLDARTKARIRKARMLREQGMSWPQIGAALGVSGRSARRLADDPRVPPRVPTRAPTSATEGRDRLVGPPLERGGDGRYTGRRRSSGARLIRFRHGYGVPTYAGVELHGDWPGPRETAILDRPRGWASTAADVALRPPLKMANDAGETVWADPGPDQARRERHGYRIVEDHRQ